jgi:glycosyltransferase involved in cell wall biosynthesis
MSMVSVVMATYNGEEYIVKQLETIRKQSQMPNEVIICDDCSTDNTVSIIRNYIKDYLLDGWYVYSNKDNLGFYDNFFKAISIAKGDTIYLADQDDLWDLKKIETIEKVYKENPKYVMIESNYRYIDSEDNEISKKINYHGKGDMEGVIPLTTQDMCKFAGSGFTMSFKRLIYDTALERGLVDMKELFCFHDVLLGMVATALGECCMVTSIIDNHRLHMQNATQRKNSVHFADRTKQKQLDLVSGRMEKFKLIYNVCKNEEKKECFNLFYEFAKNRKQYIKKMSFKGFIYLFKQINMYSSKLGLVTDTMYSIGLEKVLLCLYSKI